MEATRCSENAREGSCEPPRRRDSSDPVNLSINSGTSTTSDSSHDVVHRLESSVRIDDRNNREEAMNYREKEQNEHRRDKLR